MIELDLSAIEPMAALPFHPSEAVTLRELIADPGDMLREVEKRAAAQFGGKVQLHLTDKVKDGKLRVKQGVIAGCAGGLYDNIAAAAAILDGCDVGSGNFDFSVYPPSVPVELELVENGVTSRGCCEAGAAVQALLLRPLLRRRRRARQRRPVHPPHHPQLPQPGGLQARRRPAVRRDPDGRPLHRRHCPEPRRAHLRGGAWTTTSPLPYERRFDASVYDKRVYFGFGQPQPDAPLQYGPNIAEWPAIPALSDDLLLQVASVLRDPVTTTDELIPSGETSSYRSNPMKLAQFALSRRDPDYVPRAKAAAALEALRAAGHAGEDGALSAALKALGLTAAGRAAPAHRLRAVRQQARRRLRPGAGRLLPAGAGRLRQYLLRIRHQALPLQLRQLGHAALHAGGGRPLRRHARRLHLRPPCPGEAGRRRPGIPRCAAPRRRDAGHDTLSEEHGPLEERELLLRGCLINYYAAKNEERHG